MGSCLSLYNKFEASTVTIVSAAVATLCALVFWQRIDFLPKLKSPKWAAILFTFIVISSAAVRWPPFLYLAGGQDQGVYVSLASYIDRTGSYAVVEDSTLEKVPKESTSYYLSRRPEFYGNYFEFYPVHPVLMAVSRHFLGDDLTTFPSALIGILTAIVFYLITFQITKNRSLSLLMMAFIAFHPLHRFFSVFPVTEIPSLFFTAMTFYYFLKFTQRESANKLQISYLGLSLLYWFAFLFTRMNSFIYIPLLYGSLLMTPFLVQEKLKRRALLGYFAALLLSIVLSFFIYKEYMPFLYYLIATRTLLKPFGEDYATKILIIGVAAIALPTLLVAFVSKTRKAILGFYNHPIVRTVVVAGAFLFITYLTIQAGIEAVATTSHEMIQIINRQAFASSWQLLATTNIWTTFIYLTPVGFVIYFLTIWRERKTTNQIKVALLIFPLYYLIITILTTPHVFGGFYYSRYQISEIIPFALLFIVVTFFDNSIVKNKFKPSSAIFAGFMVCFFIAYTSQQMQGPEGAKPSFFKDIAKEVTEKDLIVVDESYKSFLGFNEIVQPLEFFYDENIISISDTETLKTEEFRKLTAGFSKVLLFSMRSLSHPAIKTQTNHEYNFGMYHNNTGHLYLAWAEAHGEAIKGRGTRVFSPPTLYSRYVAGYNLYNLDKDLIASGDFTETPNPR